MFYFISVRSEDLISGLHPPSACSGDPRDILIDAGECALVSGDQYSSFDMMEPGDVGTRTGVGSSASKDPSPLSGPLGSYLE